MIAVLKRHDFSLAGQAGSHQKWRNPVSGLELIDNRLRADGLTFGRLLRFVARRRGVSTSAPCPHHARTASHRDAISIKAALQLGHS